VPCGCAAKLRAAQADPQGPGGRPLPLFESGAILYYLAEKTGQLVPSDAAGRYETLQWLMFQMGGIGPMFGQLGFFYTIADIATVNWIRT
jgi:GST-like protein